MDPSGLLHRCMTHTLYYNLPGGVAADKLWACGSPPRVLNCTRKAEAESTETDGNDHKKFSRQKRVVWEHQSASSNRNAN